ncbi:MAG: TauD/TfdA family dioxygenase [Gammaproteobacteria bacterium]|nr:TauD/TfdA family dioxygenase [Gammaproteobacteria bacterium]
MNLDIEALTPFGARVTGLDLSDPALGPEIGDALQQALAEHLVLVFPEQELSAAQTYLHAARLFGPPMITHYSQHHMPGHPQISVLCSRSAELDAEGKPMLFGSECWHTDHTNRECPPMATMLYALRLPSQGGDTSFANMRMAYARLGRDLRARVEGLETVNRLDLNRRPASEADVARFDQPCVHPLVRTHPRTGQQALYFHNGKTERIVGMDPAQSQAFLSTLLDTIIEPEIVYTHRWRVGDLLVCDNRAVLHRAHADYDPAEGRLLHRIIVEGDRPY